jgi:chemotaxis protein methyltransferase CheR
MTESTAAERGIDDVLEAVRDATGIELHHYARSTVRRRIDECVRGERVRDPSALAARAARDPATIARIVEALCVNVTAMFRDPEFFRAYRERALPLATREGAIRTWHAGCATGEEVWSHAIVLEEAGAGETARLYGTDLSAAALLRAQGGLLPLDRMREFTRSYHRSGGREDFSAYYASDAQNSVIRSFLRRHVAFTRHDLASGERFGTFDVVFCRNVLIYFDATLQARVHLLLADSLRGGGILALGHGEALPAAMAGAYAVLDERNKLFVRAG